MNLKDFNYLIAVADLRSFVKAAEQCCISQPTLSTQIKKMEDSLGIKIFERSNKKVFPTEVGEQIIDTVRRVQSEVKQINEIASMSKDPLSGNFRLGAFPTLSTYIFPDLIPIIKKNLSEIRLILIEEKTEQLIQQLKKGQIDAAFLALPIQEDTLVSEHLFDDDFQLAVASDNPLAKNKTIKQSDLSGHQILLLDEGHCLRGQALQVCQLNGLEELQDVRATGLETLRQMVKAGTGITFIPEIAINQSESGISYIPFSKPAPRRSIALVWRKTSVRNELISFLIKLIKSEIDFK
ncbi:MAG: LysR substrate-binding domain-containing protein [Methylococcaceae bacterium]|nr:LysR substrate-binding domain-containing protein [Methylococcaceae bacterium]